MATLEEVKEQADRWADEDALVAYYENQPDYWAGEDVDDFISSFFDSYQGYYASPEEFAQELADTLGAVDASAQWPNNCIDWERAARELMYDYWQEGGHYFRNE